MALLMHKCAEEFTENEVSALTERMVNMDDKTINMCTVSRLRQLNKPLFLNTIQTTTTLSGLGILDRLPTETLYMLLEQMTIKSLMELRNTNRTAQILVETWPKYQQLLQHGRGALQVMLVTEAAAQFTAGQLIETLSTENCNICGDFAEFIYLLKCTRCCFRCAAHERQVLAIDKTQAESMLGLSKEQVDGLATIRSVSQKKFWGRNDNPRKIDMVDYMAAMALSTGVNHEDQVFGSPMKGKPTLLCQRAMRDGVYFNKSNNKYLTISPPNLFDFIGYDEGHVNRFRAIFRFPILRFRRNPIKDGCAHGTTTEYGFRCRGCIHNFNILGLANRLETRMFSESMIRHHLATCWFTKNLLANLWQNQNAKLLDRLPTGQHIKIRRVGLDNIIGWESPSSMLALHPQSLEPLTHKIDSEGMQLQLVWTKREVDCGDHVYDESQANWCRIGSQFYEKYESAMLEKIAICMERNWPHLGLDEL